MGNSEPSAAYMDLAERQVRALEDRLDAAETKYLTLKTTHGLFCAAVEAINVQVAAQARNMIIAMTDGMTTEHIMKLADDYNKMTPPEKEEE